MATTKYLIELDFQAKNLTEITQQLSKAMDLISKNGLKLGLDEASTAKLKGDVQALSNSIMQSFNKNNSKINWKDVNAQLYKSGVNAKALENSLNKFGIKGQEAFHKIRTSGLSFDTQMKDTTSLLSKMSFTLTNTLRWRVSNAALNSFAGQIQKAYGFAKQLDRSLTDIRIVSDLTNNQALDFAKKATAASKELRTGTIDYTNAALIYFQQGMAQVDVEKMTKATIIGSNITGESSEQMSELLTATMNGYRLSADQAMTVTDKLAAVGAATAADFYELATAMSKVSSIASTAGVTLDQLNGQIATIVSVTKEAPEAVGTSLKTIYSRMLAFRNESKGEMMEDEDGEMFGIPSVEAALEKYNRASGAMISLFTVAKDGTKTLRNMGDVVEEIGDSWDNTTDKAAKFGLTTSLAGTRQQNRLIALFDSWEMYGKAVATSLGAEGTSLEQNEIYLQSYAGTLKKLQVTAEELFMTLLKSDDMKAVVGVLTNFLEIVNKIITSFGGLPTILAVVAGILGKTIFQKPLLGMAMQGKKFQYPEGMESSMGNDQRVKALKTTLPEQEFEKLKKYSTTLDEIHIKLKQQAVDMEAITLLESEIESHITLIDEKLEGTNPKNLKKGLQETIVAVQELKASLGLNMTAANKADIEKFEASIKKMVTSGKLDLEQLQEEAQKVFKISRSAMLKGAKQAIPGVQGNNIGQMNMNINRQAAETAEARASITKYGEEADKAMQSTAKLQNTIMNSMVVFGSLSGIVFDEGVKPVEKFKQAISALGMVFMMNTDKIGKGMQTAFAGNNSMGSILGRLDKDLTKISVKSDLFNHNLQTTNKLAKGTMMSFNGLGTGLKSLGSVGGTALTILSTGVKGLAASLIPLLLELAPIIIAFAAIAGVMKLIDVMVVTNKELAESFTAAKSAAAEAQGLYDSIDSELLSITDRVKELNGISNRTDDQEDELALLKEKTAELEAQLRTEKLITDEKNKALSEAAANKATDTTIASKYKTTGVSGTGGTGMAVTASQVTEQDELKLAIKKWKEFSKAKKEAIEDGAKARIDGDKGAAAESDALVLKLTKDMSEVQGYAATLSKSVRDNAAAIDDSDLAYADLDNDLESTIKLYDEMTASVLGITLNTADSSEVIDLITVKYNNLSDAYKNGIISLSEYSAGVADLDEMYKSYSSTIDDLAKVSEYLVTIQDKVAKKEALTKEEMQSLIAVYPELTSAIIANGDGYNVESSALDLVMESVNNLRDATIAAENAKNVIISQGVDTRIGFAISELEMVNTLNEAYSILTGKGIKEVQIGNVRQKMAAGWKMNEDPLGNAAYSEADIAKALKGADTMVRLNKLREQIKVDASKIPNPSAKKEKKEEDAWLEAFNLQYATLQHNLAMGLIDEEQYYKALEILHAKYFKGKAKYLEEDRQYQEEVFLGLLAFYEDQYAKRLELSKAWIDKKKFYNNLSDEEEIAAYKRIQTYTEDYYKQGKISYETYAASIEEISQTLYTKQKDFAKKLLEEQAKLYETQKDDLETLVGAVESFADKKIKALEEEKQLLEDGNKAIEEKIALEQLQENLTNARLQRTKRVYHADQGWVWEADQEAITTAQKALDEFNFNAQLDLIDAQINKWEDYKTQWGTVVDSYQEKQNELMLAQQLGADWESQLLAQRTEKIVSFRDMYIKAIEDIAAVELEIDSFEENYKQATKASSTSAKSTKTVSYGGATASIDMDFKAEMNAAVKNGDKNAAATNEGLRNAKLDQLGRSSEKTYDFIEKYSTGGVNKTTGLAELHGVSSSVETIFNATDGKKLFDFVNKIPNISSYVADQISKSFQSNYFNQITPNDTNNRESTLRIDSMNVYTTDAKDFMKQMKNLVAITGNNG